MLARRERVVSRGARPLRRARSGPYEGPLPAPGGGRLVTGRALRNGWRRTSAGHVGKLLPDQLFFRREAEDRAG